MADPPASTRARRTRRRLGGVLLALVPVVTLVAVETGRPVEAMDYAKDIMLPAPGPLGAVTVFGDSVLLGSGLVSPTLPDQLQAQGWGPILFRAGVGNRAGPTGNASTAGWWIQTWRAQGWDAPNVIINLGANDSGICGPDVACARQRILDVVQVIGPGHRIWWPMITRNPVYEPEAAAWNQALSDLAAERSDFFTWDWPAELATGGYVTSDYTHLDAAGYRTRSLRMATAFTEALARAERVGGDAALPVPTAEPSTYVPLSPVRLIDTRHDAPGRRPDGSELAIDVAGRLPVGANAVAINVTAAGPSDAGYLAAGPCGRANNGSTVNFTALTDRAAMTVTPLGPDGRICVFNRAETDVIVDLQGAFVAGSGQAGFTPLGQNRRLVDTRATGRSNLIVVPTPPEAAAVAVNLTVVGAVGPGFLRATPCTTTGDVSNVNYQGVEAVAGSAFMVTSPQHTICVETSTPADVIVDLTGVFGDGGLAFVPVTPTRMLDTRNAVGGWSPIHGAGQTLDVRVAPPGARAVTGTLTMVTPTRAGYLVAHDCGPLPPTSSVNAGASRALANSLTTGVSDAGRLCVYSDPVTQSLFDVTGWWVP
jgi:lysophospholipase L1-like esterase